MNKIIISLIIIMLAMTSCKGQMRDEEIKGNLVIAGGAVGGCNPEIYLKFIELAGGTSRAKIGIIGASSSKPVHYSQLFKEKLIKYGLDSSQVQIVPIAVKDDKTTTDTDESKWLENGNSNEWAEKIKGYSGIWFVGGDQLRATKVLFNKDGSETPVLKAIWEIYKKGAVLGGTSAGAAIMSEVMIGGGSSLKALTIGLTDSFDGMNQQEFGPLYLSKGFGFFKYGIIDQHFDRKARLGRLIVANYKNKDKFPLGFGISENTAMVFYNETSIVESVGVGGVLIVDVSKAQMKEKDGLESYSDVILSYIEKGDRFIIKTGDFEINQVKKPTVGKEFFELDETQVTGVMSPNALVNNFIAYNLLDNKAVSEVKSYCFGANGLGSELIFSQTDESQGYWGYMNGQVDHYSFTKVKLDIKPIKVSIEHLDK